MEYYTQIKKDYPTADDFVDKFIITNKMTEEIYQEGEKKNIQRNKASIQKYEQHIKNIMKSRMADALYGNSTFYRIYIQNDNDLKRTLEIINK